jgi:hypothetical protein
MIADIFKSKESLILLSIILGFGLATMFRQVCKDQTCIVIKGPPMKEIKNTIYRIDDTCYKYTPEPTKC